MAAASLTRLVRWMLFVSALLAWASDSWAQPQATPVFRLGTELVVVDLIASDRSGRFVADLQPSEIRVLEDGKPQKIDFVRLVSAGRGRPADAGPGEPPATQGEAAAVPTPAPDVARTEIDEPIRVAIVIDLVTTPAEDLPRVQDAILRMVSEELPDGTETMLVSLWHGLTIQQPFTTDKNAVAAAVRGMALPTGGNLGLMEILETAQRSCDSVGLPSMPQLIAMGRSYIAEIRQQLTTTSDALGTFTRAMAARPGRKHVVLYSRGYALNAVGHAIDVIAAAAATCGGDASQFRSAAAQELSAAGSFDAAGPLQLLIDQANRSQVSFYAVDPRGLAVTSLQAREALTGRSLRGGLASRVAALDATLPQEYLRTVAGDTGGRAYLNTNDLSRGLRRAWVDASEYYVIGYTPPAGGKKGRFRKIDIKVARPDLDLRFRRGYQPATEKELLTADVERALRLPGAFEHTGLEVEAFIDRGQLHVISYLPPRAIRFTMADHVSRGEVSLHAVLRDAQGKLVGGKPLFGREVALRLTAERLESFFDSDNVEIPIEVSAPPPGTYRLIVVARDSGGWIGARTVEVTRPGT